jgi:hypothetical protein
MQFRSVRPFVLLGITIAFSFVSLAFLRTAAADDPPPLVHPIWSQLPGAPDSDSSRREFIAAAARYKLNTVEVIDVPAPPPSHAADEIKAGAAHALKLAFADALKELDAAAAEVTATGGAGLGTVELSDLYLYRAMSTARADWRAPVLAPAGAPSPDDPRERAFEDYLRAATLQPSRTLNPRELPPQVIADFARAADAVRARPRGVLTVRGSADAQVSLDGAMPAPVAGGFTMHDLPYGDHLVRVEEIGRATWGTTVALGAPTLEVEIPERTAFTLDDATAGSHAQRMGAKFALVAEPKLGPGSRLELRLVDAMGLRHDAATVLAGAELGTVDAAVMRLDEEARRIERLGIAPTSPVAAGTPPAPEAPALTAVNAPASTLLAQPRPKARFGEDPAAWARDHWPLLTAAGVVLTSAFILALTVASDTPPTR